MMKMLLFLLFIVISGATYILEAKHCNQTTCGDDIIRTGQLIEVDCNVTNPIDCSTTSDVNVVKSKRCIDNIEGFNFDLILMQIYQINATDCTGSILKASITRVNLCELHSKIVYNTTHIIINRFSPTDYTCSEPVLYEKVFVADDCILSIDTNTAPMKFTYVNGI